LRVSFVGTRSATPLDKGKSLSKQHWVAACRDREENVVFQRVVAVATGRDRTLAQFFPVLQHPPRQDVLSA
ncbi:MAG: hypothetical protein K2K84_03255, partial [Muribaculaceae bacterium]|nr:hypothetical protein [Muribaculaceae bacterium]